MRFPPLDKPGGFAIRGIPDDAAKVSRILSGEGKMRPVKVPGSRLREEHGLRSSCARSSFECMIDRDITKKKKKKKKKKKRERERERGGGATRLRRQKAQF